MPFVHLAARATPGLRPFEAFAAAAWTWKRLRAAFPSAVAAVLMPTHVQLVADVDDVVRARARFARTLGHLQRWWAPGGAVWERVRTPKIVPPGGPLFREQRYVILNPTRAGLCRDPLEWPWSTHRDLMGAVADPWVDAERVAHALQRTVASVREHWHGYASGDPSVAIEGTALPSPAAPTDVPTRPLHEILCAAGAALRIPAPHLRSAWPGRRLFLALARHQGWTDNARLAELVGLSPRGVRFEASVDPAALQAAALCLGDRRLWSPFADNTLPGCRAGRLPPLRDVAALGHSNEPCTRRAGEP